MKQLHERQTPLADAEAEQFRQKTFQRKLEDVRRGLNPTTTGPAMVQRFLGWLFQKQHNFEPTEGEEWTFLAHHIKSMPPGEYEECCSVLEATTQDGFHTVSVDDQGNVKVANPAAHEVLMKLAWTPDLQALIPQYFLRQSGRSQEYQKYREKVVASRDGHPVRVRDLDGCSACLSVFAPKVCAGCLQTRCNVDCQRRHWREHKKVCKWLQKAQKNMKSETPAQE